VKRVALFAALATASITAPVSAQPSSKARSDATAAYQEGQRRYLAEDYVAAAAQFEAAYKLDPDPAYLFNIAQAYRLAKDCGKALAFYKRFLAEAQKPPNLDAVKKYIRELEAQCPSRESTTSPPPTTTDTSPAALPATTTTSDEHRIDESTPPARSGHLVRNLGIGALGVGAIGVTMGVVFTFKVRSDVSDREALCPSFPCDWNDEKKAREAELLDLGHQHEKLMVASYIVGGAALAAGAVMLVMSHGPHESSVAIVPTQGGAFASWSLRR
jgi:tetratricopeptide (TPR) repeat protein